MATTLATLKLTSPAPSVPVATTPDGRPWRVVRLRPALQLPGFYLVHSRPDHIVYVANDGYYSEGCGGATLRFALDNNEWLEVQGPWYGNAKTLFWDTGDRTLLTDEEQLAEHQAWCRRHLRALKE